MEIIMLTGDSKIGKTAALHFVHEILVATDGVEIIRVEHVGAKNQRDFSTVLKYKGKKIMIFSMGDVYEDEEVKGELEETIKIALYIKKCDFFICACNDYKFYEDFTIKEPHLFEKTEYYPIEKTEAKSHNDRLKENWDYANKIIKRLKDKIPTATSLSITQIELIEK